MTEEDRFELVHSRVGEEECGVVEGCAGGGWDVGVGFVFEVFDECGSYSVGGPFDFCFVVCGGGEECREGRGWLMEGGLDAWVMCLDTSLHISTSLTDEGGFCRGSKGRNEKAALREHVHVLVGGSCQEQGSCSEKTHLLWGVVLMYRLVLAESVSCETGLSLDVCCVLVAVGCDDLLKSI